MWAEARKQERKIRGIMVDYRKRAERRQDFYEKIKADPTQFMQIHGRRCKIHLDPMVAAAAENPAIMMPWQGHADNLIDRFDVRAHLDYIPPVTKTTDQPELNQEERQCNYEGFRILAQNDFLGISEEKFLHQLHLEEQFGVNAQQLEIEKVKKKNTSSSGGGAAIGYTYEDDSYSAGDQISKFNSANIIASAAGGNAAQEEDSDSDIDVDVPIDINKIDTQQAHDLNTCGRNYGMQSNDFYSFLTKDADEAESLKLAREEEQEKIMLCGRKSRRERRAQREKRFAGRTISPPSYAAKEEPTKPLTDDKNDSDSRSPSPENSGKITYITSFGGEDELGSHSKISINFNRTAKGTLGSELIANRSANAAKISGEAVSYADKVKQNLEKLKHLNDQPKSPRKPLAYQRRGHTKSRSRSRSHSKKSYHRNYRRLSPRSRYRRSRSRSTSRRRGTHRRSRSRDRHRHYSTSSSSSSSSSTRRNKRRRSLSTSSSSSSSSSRSSSSSSRSSIPRRQVRSKSIERNKKDVKSQSKEREKSVRTTEKLAPPNQKTTTIIAPINPTPTEIPPLPPAESASPIIREQPKLPEVQVPIKKYYGRKRDNQSSSDEDDLSYEEAESTVKSKSDTTTSSTVKNINLGKAATIHTKDSSASGGSKTLNPRDRLKKKMQILLNKQYKADKMAEIEKNERQIQQQQERDDEMREMALRLRRRQRELRHKYGSPGGDSDKSDGSALSNRSSVSRGNRGNSRQRTKYRSPSHSNRSRSRSHDSRRKERAKYSSHRRHSRDSSRHRRSRERSKNRSTSRDYRRRSNSNERRRNNDRPRKLVDY
ncbi:CLK4-associating serine/arginine rich protein [Contarinia nasturtii]|uniref:CLK4-associating serine/arginine rich protein n=1 Tax=Contarinia nasturtii TaxID=265458 RepID=UPI0012D4A8FF|nr:CLK4-associating serine/arginine rich protein [Contarinia nasturtii]